MKTKTITTAVLLTFVVVSAAYLLFTEMTRDKNPSQSSAGTGASEVTGTGDKVVVYYFHATKRCKTCKTIEAYAEEAIRTGFEGQLESGALEWRTVNVDKPENQHFIEDFELATRTVVLVDVEDGVEKKWARLDRVWELVGDKKEFTDYIWENTNDFLTETDG
jgi:hypothetical protein